MKLNPGDGALAKLGKALPESAIDSIKKSQACLKGPVGETAGRCDNCSPQDV